MNTKDIYKYIYTTTVYDQLYLYSFFSPIITSTTYDSSLISEENIDDIDILLNALICEDAIENRPEIC